MQHSDNDVWVFIEQRDGAVADVSLELCCKGRKLADAMAGKLKAVVIAGNAAELADRVFYHHVDEVLAVEDPTLVHYRTLPYARILIELVRELRPRVLLFGATTTGRDLAPRVASATKSGLTADCTDLRIEDVRYVRTDYKQLLLQIRPAFGGNIVATIISPDTTTQMATVREGVMELRPASERRSDRIVRIAYQRHDQDELVELLAREHTPTRSNLKAAPIIVAGGYGLGTRQGFQLVHDLARTIGGEVAGTRAAVDAGFIPPDRQIGQTGITVRPKLYVAVGISGAIQHVAGMKDSNKIVAINSDPGAPIFDVAHYGIVGDAADVVPRLIQAYRERLH